MFCTKCGTEQVDNPKFCRNCGEKLDARDTIGQMEVAYPHYLEPTEEGVRWSIGRVFSFIVIAAVLTVILYYFLLIIGASIAGLILPDNIHYVNDGWCDVGHEPAGYIHESEDGQTIGEFCYLHAVLFNLDAKFWSDEEIYEAPLEIKLLSQWLFLVVAVFISIPVAWWWESRKSKQKRF